VTAAPIRSRSLNLLGHDFRLFHVPAERTRDALLVWRGLNGCRSPAANERLWIACAIPGSAEPFGTLRTSCASTATSPSTTL
jgi:hypothetical protein